MTFLEMLGLLSAMTFLGVFLTVYALINNRTLKEESRHTREILDRIEQGQSEARKDVAEARKETVEAIAEARKEAAQAMAEARKAMAEAIKYVADLIKLESEKTREAIRDRP